MSLINYIEPVNAGSIFAGIGVLIISIVMAYFLFRLFKPICKWVEGIYNHDSKYWIVEEKMLDQVAKERGINLDEELLKRDIIETKRKSFRKRIEEEVFNKMFPEEKTKKKD